MRFKDVYFRPLAATAIAGLLAGCGGSGSPFAPQAGALQVPGGTQISWQDLGRAGDATRVNVAIVLKYRNEDQLDALVDAQGDSSSSQYHHFLTSGQFAQKYAPTQADYESTMATLRAAGFTIDHTFANRTVIDASAPATAAERLFATEIHLARRNDGNVRYINVRPETIPASLPAVLVVVGLDNVHTLRPNYVFKPGAHRVPYAMRNAAKKPLFGPDGGYGPQVYRISYAFPKGMNGKGRASAVVGDADFLDSDLAGYLNFFKVKRTGPATVRVLVDGGPPKGISQDSVEATLDVETIVSIDPATALYVYEAPTEPDLRYFVDMYNQAVTDNKADTVNTSYSECETAFIPSFPKAAEAVFKQGAALGITFHGSTGDSGTFTYGCSSSISLGTPSDTPHNIAVGGTIEQVNPTTGQETSEVGWNDGSGATGGGISVVFKTPTYQKNVPNVIPGHRNTPDIAFDASPFTGESLFFQGAFQGPIGGTSLSSPIFGAGLTAIDEMHNSRAGFFNPTLYKTWKANGYSKGSTIYLRDITSGSIGPYQAKTGYDQMSGIGAMLFGNFGALLH
jgi:subtilase family serine protease